MLSKLKAMFAKSSRADEVADDLPLSVGVLLVEAARADETYDVREQALVDAALSTLTGADAGAASAIRMRAEAAQAQSQDLHRFTRVAKTLSIEDKTRLVESLWRVALSDGNKDPYEDALIRRVCGLIYFSDPESGAARRRVENELQAQRA